MSAKSKKGTKKNIKKTKAKPKKNIKKNKSKIEIVSINPEVLSIIFICFSFLLFFSIYSSSEFILTTFLRNLFVFIFGFSAYVVPFVLIIIGSIVFVNKENLDKKKYLYSFILICVLSSLFTILSQVDFNSLNGQGNFIVRGFKYASTNNGGLIGIIFGGLLKKLVGKFISTTLLLIISCLLISLLFNKSYAELFSYFKVSMDFLKEKIEDSLKFDSKNEDDDEVIIKDLKIEDEEELPKVSAFLNKDTSFKVDKKELDELSDIDYSVYYGIDRKRENKVRDNDNLKDGNGFFKKNTQKIQKMNPFNKKPKIRILQFSEEDRNYDPTIMRNLEHIGKRNEIEQSGFITVKKGERKPVNEEQHNFSQNQEQYQEQYTYQEPNIVVNEPIVHEFVEPNINNEKIEQLEKTVKSLKDELNRQMFLFQDTQKELIDLKNNEKILMKIMNAQRDTIDKQASELKVYEHLSKKLSLNTNVSENTINTQNSFEEPVIEEVFEPVKADTIEIEPIRYENDFEEINEIKQNNDENTNNLEEDFEVKNNFDSDDFYNNLDLTKDITDFGVNFDFSEEKVSDDIYAEYKENLITENDEDLITASNVNAITEGNVHLTSENNDYNVGIPHTDTDIYESYNFEKTEEVFDENVYEEKSEPSSIFKSEADVYRTPIKPNFDYIEKEPYIYKYPAIDFLNSKPVMPKEQNSKTELIANSKKLEATLKSFGVVAKVLEVSKGPSVTRYEIQPGLGVKVSKISNLADDLALNLAAKSIRIQAPIPGKAAVGIEVPNDVKEMVYLKEVLEDQNFRDFKSKLAFGIGKDITGKIVVTDLATMPHLLIAGSTGSGKSVCVNTLITSIVYKSSPDEVKLLMIDPKVVELSVYNGIPHLLIPVVTDPKKASAALNWAVREMEKRYKLFSDKAVRDLKGYNEVAKSEGIPLEPQIVIIIDELADLMMTASKEVESAIQRLAQMARAAGIHLIIATQRPTVDVLTGTIKTNIPSRIAFAVSSGIDSKTILDEVGAEKLLGKGDMLFKPMGSPEPYRVQGAFISDKEVESIVSFLKTDTDHEQMKEIIEEITSGSGQKQTATSSVDEVDEILEDVVEFIIEQQKASTSLIQRRFRVGFNRAARIVDELENFGVIGPDEGNKPRKVLMSMTEWDNKFKV